MANPIEKIRKLKGRTWTELRFRGEQAISAYKEQIGLSGKLPGDEEFLQLIDRTRLNGNAPTKDNLLHLFYENAGNRFFQSFKDKTKTIEFLKANDENAVRQILEKAKRITQGKFDLLGYENLDFGDSINWHFEPISGKRIPSKHWKLFDELDSKETGDKKIVWELNRHQHFFVLGAAYLLSNDEKFAATFIRHLDSWMEQNQPGMGVNWVSSLEVSFRAMSWIWAFHFFKESESMSSEVFRKALKFLYVHARHIEKFLSTYYSPNTHLTGEALGLYYLGTQLPFFKRADHWRNLGKEILLAELDRQILPDGVYFEQSTWYQRYTVDFYTHFFILETLGESKLKPEEDSKLNAKTQKAIDFLMFATRPDGTSPFIGDDDGGFLLPLSSRNPNDFRSVLSTGSVIFKRPDYKYVARNWTEETLWLLGADGIEAFDALRAVRPENNSFAFKEGGYLIMRDGWETTDNYLLIDCGNMGEPSGGHSHADALSLNLAAGGRTILIDPGTYSYHESKEIRDYFRSTSAHNTLTINQKSSSELGGKFSWETMSHAKIDSWISENRFDYFSGSHNGYSRLANPATHSRSVLFLKNDYWIVRDYAETSGENEFGLHFHFDLNTNPEIGVAKNGSNCVTENAEDNSGIRLLTFGDNGLWQAAESWVSPCYGRKEKAPVLNYVSKGISSQEFFTFMMPTAKAFAAPEVFESEVTGGRAFVIKYRDYNDLFVFSDGGGQMIRTEFFDTNFKFLWARLSDGEAMPEEFVMIDGTHFVLGGREILNQQKTLKFASARRLGAKLNVKTDQSVFTISLPQKRSSTYILKNSLQS